MTSFALRRRAALAALVLAACTDRTPTEVAPPLAGTGEGEWVGMQIACTASVAGEQVRCGAPAPSGGAAASIILGGQGTYLRLETSGAAYDSVARVFSLGAAVRNLLGQQMGTPDGQTATGIQVFFEQEPVATEGVGEVTVANADGEANFTRAVQPYFDYPQIVEPGATSEARTWRFNVPPAVRTFNFTVYVRTELPAEQGVLRWVKEYEATGYDLNAVSASGTSPLSPGPFHALAVGSTWVLDEHGSYLYPRGVILANHGDGNWSEEYRLDFSDLADVWAGPHVSVAVGSRSQYGGLILRRVGGKWEDVTPVSAHGIALEAVWGEGTQVHAFGTRMDGRFRYLVAYHSTDEAATWRETSTRVSDSGWRPTVTGAWGSGSNVVHVTAAWMEFGVFPAPVGFRARYDGTAWALSPSDTGPRNGVWSRGDTVFVSGIEMERSVDGGRSWTRMDLRWARAVWGSAGNAVYALVGWSEVHAFDGVKWSTMQVGNAGTLMDIGGWGRNVYVIGSNGSIFHGTR